MSEKNIVICDKEVKYAEKLMENIMERNEFAVKVYVCSTWENVKILSQDRSIHILVVDETYAKRDCSEVDAEQIFVLTTGNCKNVYREEKCVYKYQCVDQILSEILETYFEKTKENVMKSVKKEFVKIIAIYSPIHRVGKTSFAIAFGKELAKFKKVLYLNMEEYFGYGEMFEQIDNGNLGDALYYTKQENSNFGLRLRMLVRTIDELDYIPPMPVSLDLKEVRWEEWKVLFKQIVEDSVYEVILLDIGESVQGLLKMLDLCDRIYMPVLEDDVSQEKLRKYEDNLQRLQLERLMEKAYMFIGLQDIENKMRQLVKEEVL